MLLKESDVSDRSEIYERTRVGADRRRGGDAPRRGGIFGPGQVAPLPGGVPGLPAQKRKLPHVSDTFQSRHLGPRGDDLPRMLAAVGAASLDGLIDEIVPPDIRLTRP